MNQSDDRKLKELILYITHASTNDPVFEMVKLNKLLFLADFVAYRDLGKSITGQEYHRLSWGPSPKRLPLTIIEMNKDGEITEHTCDFHKYGQRRFSALRKPNLTIFTTEEVKLMVRLVSRWWYKLAAEIDPAYHRLVSWEYAEQGEDIPYCIALVNTRGPTEAEVEYGKSIERGLQGTMARWEYLILGMDKAGKCLWNLRWVDMDQLGAAGWELVAVFGADVNIPTAAFKRLKQKAVQE